MQYNTTTNKYKKDRWQEYFKIYISLHLLKYKKEGFRIPSFYLPIRRHNDTFTIECWFFLIAPIVWIIYFITDFFWYIWKQMYNVLELLTRDTVPTKNTSMINEVTEFLEEIKDRPDNEGWIASSQTDRNDKIDKFISYLKN